MMVRVTQEITDLTGRTILQVIPRLDIGGAEATTVEMVGAIVANGGRALVASAGGRLVAEIESAGGVWVPMAVASKNPLRIYANIGRLARLARAERVDIIHARSRAPAWSALAAARRVGVPFLATYHSRVSERPWAKRLYNSVLTRGQVVIANSHFTADAIARVHKVSRERICVIPRGCDADALARDGVAPQAVAAQRAEWGVPDNAFVIICPARLTSWKGQAVLLEAVARLDRDLPIWVVLAGSAQGREAYVATLKADAQRLGIAQRVVFAGLVTDMQRAYAAAHLAVLPSLVAEPFGRTCIEAQAASLPVIASAAGGFCETVRDGETGWLVRPDDAAALAEALRAVWAMPSQDLIAMGREGRAHIEARFTVARMCAATLAVYRSLLVR